MSTWVIISWVSVAIITGINIFLFLRLKQASEQMMKMAFPHAKNMTEAMGQMQSMMGNIQKKAPGKAGNAFASLGAGQGNPKNRDAQLRAAMEMLQRSQKKR